MIHTRKGQECMARKFWFFRTFGDTWKRMGRKMAKSACKSVQKENSMQDVGAARGNHVQSVREWNLKISCHVMLGNASSPVWFLLQLQVFRKLVFFFFFSFKSFVSVLFLLKLPFDKTCGLFAGFYMATEV